MRTGCKHHGDCFTCPFADCILNELEAAQQDAIDGINQEKKRSPKYEYNHRRYMARRESEKEKQKIYRERRKAGLPQKEEKLDFLRKKETRRLIGMNTSGSIEKNIEKKLEP